MRSSRSLNRLDQRSSDLDRTAAKSSVKKGQITGKKSPDSDQLSSSEEHLSCSQPETSSSFLAPSSACHHPSNKEKKQTRDGVYTLCAMTSGMKRNWVQAVLKNVRPNPPPENATSLPAQKADKGDPIEDSHPTQQQQGEEEEKSSADGKESLSASPSSPPHTGVTDALYEYQSDSSASTIVMSNDEYFEDSLEQHSPIEQNLQQDESTNQEEEPQTTANPSTDDKETLPCEHNTGQLVKELEQTQKELSRVQQINRNLQQEKDANLRKLFSLQNEIPPSSDQSVTLHQMQWINHNLRMELEAMKRSQEEARETELRRRVDLLAQQAQLLVTGDATALAQIQLDQDRQRFQEQQQDWERCVASLKSQLSISEEKRKEAEVRLTQLQQELQNEQRLQQEAEQLRKHLQDMSAQLHAYEEAQAEKEARLQKHLMLLQASQERERNSLAASLAQAEKTSQDLQSKLDRAEQQVENLNKSQSWTREIEEAQRLLQEELECTVSAVQQLQEEREQLARSCQELQNHLSEAEREVNRLQERLKTEETHYYNLEHAHERVCEELQVALSKVQQRESETQDIREGYERLLDRKEQELNEILLKMEVLGNSLEETEMKLSEAMKVRKYSQLIDESINSAEPKQKVLVENQGEADSFQFPKNFNATEVNSAQEQGRIRSRSLDASYQYIATAEDDPEKFMSAIQLLETKLFVTEEKLRDITERLEEQQSDTSSQDPRLCSQLTQSRANVQHFSLLLHSQAKQSQRYAQETESCCRMLVGRFQVALNIVQACRERLQSTSVNIPEIERQLTTVAACLQQGEKEAERVQHESRNASKENEKILSDEMLSGPSPTSNQQSVHDVGSVSKCLTRELFIVDKMASVLQSQNGVCLLSAVSRANKRDGVGSYKNITSRRIALKTEELMESEPLDSVIVRACAEAELIYAALKLQQEFESTSQETEDQNHAEANSSPSESIHFERKAKEVGGRGSEEVTKLAAKRQSDDDWLERLVSRLQRKATFLRQICPETNNRPLNEGGMNFNVDITSSVDLDCIQEQVKVTYLSDRIYLDLEREFKQWETVRNKMQTKHKEKDENLMDKQEALNQLQEDNTALRHEIEQAEQKILCVETSNQRLLEEMQKIEDYHKEKRQKLETEFQEKIKELQQIHEEEMQYLHTYYTKSCASREKLFAAKAPQPTEGGSSLSGEEERKTEENLQTDAVTMRETHLKEIENLQASCDQGFTAMEEMHRKLIKDLQEQHQQQVAELLKEKDQLLQEETAATMAAIVAMRRAHKQELERSRQSQHIKESGDITQIRVEYEKEIRLLHKELEVLSAQHTDKCLENSQLSQELQTERKSVTQYRKENQELQNKQSVLKAKEAEMQFLRQEARSLREELDIARVDKLLAQNKLKAFHGNQPNEAHLHVHKDPKFATWSPHRDTSGSNPDDSVKTSSNPAAPKKMEKSFLMRQIRGIRSKVIPEFESFKLFFKLFIYFFDFVFFIKL
ncbi:trichohyalin isoform X1 [Oryzias melastigma]|uniref:trichohyalin isoform X1 n=1 Tax=Oryzias melastigma TaxID=30732 RepID=UPI00168CE9BD|nr:trichohyalin isoform X1 [Oryzias melastigma]